MSARVYVQHRLLPARWCQARDLSASGIFIETPDAEYLPRGTRLTITFAVEVDSVTKLHRLDVAVAQAADEGVGVQILERRRQPRQADRRRSDPTRDGYRSR